jgi:hypothetical protein
MKQYLLLVNRSPQVFTRPLQALREIRICRKRRSGFCGCQNPILKNPQKKRFPSIQHDAARSIFSAPIGLFTFLK